MVLIGLNCNWGITHEKIFKKLTLITAFLGLLLFQNQQNLCSVKAATISEYDEKPLTEQQNPRNG
ncbi:hypothetical protein [Lactobacillus juensis]|uniref:hypothetical protein n=1 Tax=Lactobacillus juensis TaxID=3082862 RepID=UPI0030C731E9